MEVHDLIGIGFGPSNLALAIALNEKPQKERPLNTLFLERQPVFAWHKHMMLEDTRMQISFLKDLVSLRNPKSHFTFVNYLHQKQRLQDFINLKTFYPSRYEFNDYLNWAASHFEDHCRYGEEVVSITPEKTGDEVSVLRVHSINSDGTPHERLTRNLVVSIGGAPHIPEAFLSLKADARVFHSSSYLQDIRYRSNIRNVAIIGSGQSAAEIFMDLQKHPDSPNVDIIMRGHTLRVSDNSPFVNEIFNSDFVDFVYHHPDKSQALIKEFWHTNYSAPDVELAEKMFEIFYNQKIKSQYKHRFLKSHTVTSAQAHAEGVCINTYDMVGNSTQGHTYDAVILATGYMRNQHETLLAPLLPYLGDLRADRQYRLGSTENFKPAVFLQGACEDTHGLSDTLLSVISTRVENIRSALVDAY